MITVLLTYLVCGTLVGLLSGLFGIGGGIIGIPVVLQCLSKQGVSQSSSMHMAIGTMLAVAAVTTLTAVRSHHKSKMILVPLFKKIAPYLVTGSFIGTMISSQLNSIYLQRMFAIFLLFAAWRMVVRTRTRAGKEVAAIQDGGMDHDRNSDDDREKVAPVTTFAIGILSGLLGLGGGVLLVPYLHWRGIPMKSAIATATACILPAAMVGAVSSMMMSINADHSITFSTGYIYWPAFLGISMMSMLFAPIGARLTHKAAAPVLKTAFSILLIAVAFHLAK